MTKLTFLGTGGGRFATILQKRGTGGIYVADRGILIHIDPGPGALVKLHELGLDPTQTDAILVSHCHPDHYSDAEILTEAMTMGGNRRRGTLVGSHSVLHGTPDYSPLSHYHQGLPKTVASAEPGDRFSLKEWYTIEATPTRHSDETTVGFKMHLNGGIVSYTSDTEYFEELADAHSDARILVVCMTRPLEHRIPFHLSTEDAAQLIGEVQPEFAILTHMGMKTIPRAAKQATWIAEQTGISTIAAKDGMRIYANDQIEVKRR